MNAPVELDARKLGVAVELIAKTEKVQTEKVTAIKFGSSGASPFTDLSFPHVALHDRTEIVQAAITIERSNKQSRGVVLTDL